MNSTAFNLHRADQRMLALQRALLEDFPITPARYLVLLFIRKSGHDWVNIRRCWMVQSDIWKTLGVRPPTTSKMLKQLEALGFVRRKRSITDKRQVLVFLTRKARGLFRRIQKEIIEPGILWIATYTILQRAEDVGRVEFLCERLRRALHDYATYWFPHCKRTLYPERRYKTPPPFEWPIIRDEALRSGPGVTRALPEGIRRERPSARSSPH